MLKPQLGEEFSGSSIPSGWMLTGLSTGSAVVGGRVVRLDGKQITGPTAYTYVTGRSAEFVATFTGAANQQAGFNLLRFSTSTGGALYAETVVGRSVIRTSLGDGVLRAPHRFRIEWNASSVVYRIDGAVVATHTATFTSTQTMSVIANDATAGGDVFVVDWMRVGPSAGAGTHTSRVFNAGGPATWASASWVADVPAGTSVTIEVRSGNSALPDATWTGFIAVPASGSPVGITGQYVQYRARLAGNAGTVTPVLKEVTLNYSKP
jgi:hypothetical protein